MTTCRKILFWTHLTVGCFAGLVIAVMAATGVVLAYERQINSWADAPTVSTTNPTTPPMRLDAIVAKLMSTGRGVPDQLVLHHDDPNRVDARYGREQVLFVNLQTGDVSGESSKRAHSFFSQIEQVHRFLGLGFKSTVGKGLTGAANLLFLFMLVTGLYLWLPKQWTASAMRVRLLVRRGVKGRAREWNLHNTVGIWTALPLLVIVLTATVESYPWANQLLYRIGGTSTAPGGSQGGNRASAQHQSGQAAGQFVNWGEETALDRAAVVAEQADTQWNTITIPIPKGGEKTLAVASDRSSGGRPDRVTRLIINRQTGTLVKKIGFADGDTGGKLRAWSRFLHTGEEFGIVGQTIAMLASLGAVFLVWTGFSMTWRRLSVKAFAIPKISAKSPDHVAAR
jgi:uncharacterized iron-regulated membrane protein